MNTINKVLKKAEFEIQYYYHLVLNKTGTKTILFYPEFPSKRAIIYKMIRYLKYNITNNLSHVFDLVINWEDSTYRTKDNLLKELEKKHLILNINCNNISKEEVNTVFEKVFGYSLHVDAAKFVGRCVKKSNLNAKHDGVTVNCPLDKKDENYVYQKILDNSFDENLVYDLRVPVVNDAIPFVYLKFKKTDERFTNNVYKSTLEETNKYLSEEEKKNIVRFCNDIGLDIGELDVIRNKDDNKIYIVDVNNTPWGPPFRLPEKDGNFAIKTLAEKFSEKFVK